MPPSLQDSAQRERKDWLTKVTQVLPLEELVIGENAGLNIMSPRSIFEQHGSPNKQDWDLAFEHGYEDGFKKTHRRQ